MAGVVHHEILRALDDIQAMDLIELTRHEKGDHQIAAGAGGGGPDEGSAALYPIHDAVLLQTLDSPLHRDTAQIEAFGNLLLGGKTVAFGQGVGGNVLCDIVDNDIIFVFLFGLHGNPLFP